MASIIRRIIRSPQVVAPLAPYSQGVVVNNVLYLSGQIGMNLEQEVLEGIENQTRQALTNIGHVLTAAGATYNNVVKVTVLLDDIKNFDVMNKVYSEFFTQNLPARAAYQVAKLPKNALIEIEAVAVVGEITESKL
ncbi:unnamed protein product [Allacma fusca]|uniref:Uncharacterized protein n=1 Tax=Allacma fusca TaxID=39272 RepID=A0A8J2PWS5_9HEXA|nr:unnamed protein product [Allacma fusca]